MAVTAVSVLILACAACQSQRNHDMPQLQTNPASAKLDVKSTTSQSKVVAGTTKEMPPGAPTARQLGCSQSQAWHPCGKAAEMCVYKFKVDKVDQQTLWVSYPQSVWDQTMESMRDREAEAKYRKEYDKTYPIPIKRSENPIEAGKIYLFTRCTDNGKNDNDFTLGEVQPDEPGGPQQSTQ